MTEEQAIQILKERAAKGALIGVAANGDFRVIKRLLSQCLEADIPVTLGPCRVQG